jgi:hypothetical protein
MRYACLYRIACLPLLAMVSCAAFAWGEEGHSIVAEIAQRRLNPDAQQGVAVALGSGVSLASVSSWADGQRAAHPGTANWHFVDIPLPAAAYDEKRDCADNPAHGDCVVRELQRLHTELRCLPTPEGRRDALRYAVHFVGDLHQPLHTVGEKMGGNQQAVHGVMRGLTCKRNCELGTETANLHVLWDTTLIRRTVWDWGSYVTRLEDGLLRSADVQRAAATAAPGEWANQTHAVAQSVWNEKIIGADGSIDDGYFETALPLLDRQLALAGLRLADFLNSAYGATSCPAQQH